jgi:hypothetical protein
MADTPRVRFRNAVTSWLNERPRATVGGVVQAAMRSLTFGAPSGSHGDALYWVYSRTATELEMCFAFYVNFTQDDLLCKIFRAGEVPKDGQGASIQFNGEKCMENLGPEIGFYHDGRVTLTHPIGRQTLVETIAQSAADGMDLLGGPNTLKEWPFEVGTTKDLAGLIDRLFLYAYCIEQAKRTLRGEGALPRLRKEASS